MKSEDPIIDPDLPPGSQMAQYKLLRPVGAGGMGVVYLAWDVELERDAAVKVLKRDALGAAGTDVELLQQRFLREARSAAKLSHPNVAAVYQVGRHGTRRRARVFIAMEWLAGGSLADHLQHHIILDWRDATAAVRDAALGLAAAHGSGIIHRDIKPSNLMRTPTGQVKLVDFGLAREFAAVSDLTEAGSIMGTPTYMSPEQCRGEPATPLSDVYALGCTLFHLLASRPPFEAESVPGLLHQQINEPLPDIRRFAEDVPEALMAVLARACAKRPADRFATAAELADALSAALTNGAGRSTAIPATIKVAIPVDPPNNLPHETSSFVGREQELADIATALAAARLTTLLGPGGTGKTRLALQTARRSLRMFPAGVWMVELANIAAGVTPDAVARAVSSALGLKESSGRSAADILADHLRDADALLVIDNCEHLIETAAQLCADLLERCSKLRLLATSRQPLRIPGETALRVPSLTTPDTDDVPLAELEQLPSVRLFVERARAVRPGFALSQDNAPAIARICRRLDGIPLAIELAAARAKVLSAQQIAERLGDAFKLLTGGSRTLLPRQQTLRALIDWSYELLDDRARAALARMSVFAGGCTFEAAESILPDGTDAPDAPEVTLKPEADFVHDVSAAVPIDAADVLDLLCELVEHSLVIADERDGVVRYRMLETIRQYAAEKLAVSPIERRAVRTRHARFFEDFAVTSVQSIQGPTQAQTLAALAADHDNLRAAMDHSIQDRRVEIAVPLGAALAKYWNIRGMMAEGVRTVDAIMQLNPPENATLARLLDSGGVLAIYFGEPGRAAEWFERALALARAAGELPIVSSALNNLSTLAKEQGDLRKAYDLGQQALQVRLVLGDLALIAGSYNNIGNIARAMGRPQEARELLGKSMAIAIKRDDTRWIAYGHLNLGELEVEQGNADIALPLYTKCLEILKGLDEEWGMAYAEEGIARCLLAKGDLSGARSRLESALAVCRKFGDKANMADQLDFLAHVELQQGNPNDAMAHSAASTDLRLTINDRGGIATSLETRALLLAATDSARSAALLGCADQLRNALGMKLAEGKRIAHEQLLMTLKAAIGEATFAEQFGRGAATPAESLLQT
ncbi:protein kinase domain-containing protein [Humisphaera borealis]|uniref:Tetratricopeptide repeat protein n=1 Tax=Humisphaera borealis TaxID=2807512 RepID=A0A7M2WU86_9BACT|nr:tetratricopeptide repeat protein [Humisphaera borealis]QOV89046.1 tetratricopeptide repeat protein [Humisphaera borealis]